MRQPRSGRTSNQIIGTHVDITQHKSAEAALHRRNRQLDLIASTSHALMTEKRPEVDVLATLCASIGELIDADIYYHYRVADEPAYLQLSICSGVSVEDQTTYRMIRVGEQLCGRVAETRKPILVENLQHAEHPGSEKLAAAGATSYAGFPLVANGELVGTIAFVSRQRTQFREGEVSTIATICDQIATWLSRARLERELEASEAEARTQLSEIEAIYASARVGLCVLDRNLRYRRVNERLAEMNGVSAADHIGRTVREIVPLLADAAEPALRRILETGEPVVDLELAGETHAQPGILRHWIEQFQPLRDSAGAIIGINISAEEITDRKHAEDALRRSEERFRTIVETAQEGIWTVDKQGFTKLVNARMAELLGTTREAMIGRRVQDYCFAEDLDDLDERMATNVAGQAEEFEFRFRRADGTPVHVLAATAPLRDSSGMITGSLAGILDLTERKRAEQRQQVLMNELAHRGKNLLAVIQSITSRSLSGGQSLEDARTALIGRIQALSNTYGHLTNEKFEGAPLGDILNNELASFGGRIHCSGPTVILTAKVAQTFALIIHELATNAAKYGALSVHDGHLHVNWSAPEKDGERRFNFDWREEGGPPVKPPTRRGFGSTLINRIANAEFKCIPRIDFLESGFCYGLDAALTDVGQVTDESPVRNRLKSEALRSFYDTWASLRGSELRTPIFKQLKRDHFTAIGNLTVAEISSTGAVQLLEVGRALTERLGQSLDPKQLMHDDPDGLHQAYKHCADCGLPCYEHLHFDFGDGDPVTFERLLLPFSRGGRRVTHVVGLVVISGETSATKSG